MAVGIVVTTLAGLIPAVRATRVPPVAVLREAAVAEPGSSAAPCAAVVGVVGRPAERLGGSSGGLARRNAMRNPGRTFSTAMALTIGVALVTLVTVVAAGLKDDDDVVAGASRVGRPRRRSAPTAGRRWTPSVVCEAAEVPGVRAVSGIRRTARRRSATWRSSTAIDPATLPQVFRFDWAEGDDDVAGDARRDGAIVDEGWAAEHGLKVGSTFDVTSANGTTLP